MTIHISRLTYRTDFSTILNEFCVTPPLTLPKVRPWTLVPRYSDCLSSGPSKMVGKEFGQGTQKLTISLGLYTKNTKKCSLALKNVLKYYNRPWEHLLNILSYDAWCSGISAGHLNTALQRPL